MSKLLAFILVAPVLLTLLIVPYNESFAQGDEGEGDEKTYFDSVKFIQYLDENTALEEVKNGNLDTYYYTISPDRLENSQNRGDLQVFDSTGGSFSLLVNPADTEKFNPFASRDIRFALNYLVDRKLIVNELMGGYGAPIISYYGPSNPEYLTVIEQLETFNFKYNPTYAEQVISKVLTERGAIKSDGKWQANGEPIEITMFIRSDDPVRKSIGEILAVELEKIGFTIKKDFGDLNKAFVVVYGSNPADLKWHLYTEGWGSSAFVRYDSVALAQMYSPWFSNMPGFNDPSYWNYKNDEIDGYTQKIYTSEFETAEERTELIQKAVVKGIEESVRIFLASTVDQYVVNQKVSGVVNDFGAGIPSRFTPINAKSDHKEFVVGVKQIYQGAWNPIMGLTDTYSNHIWNIIADPATGKHPFTGETFPIRTTWEVETAGPNGRIDIPDEAIMWNPSSQTWDRVVDANNVNATSKVTFDFKFSNWHNGEIMDIQDVLYSLYFVIEWGTQIDENDKTFDTEFTPRAAQSIQTIVGVNPIDADTMEVYVDYWHFDQGEIADWAAMWSSVPWEITSAMEEAVTDGKVAFSRSGATSKNVNWLSLIIPNDAQIIKEYLQEFRDTGHVPSAFREDSQNTEKYYQDRYNASIKWIDDNNHAVISNGPFYLESYSPESRTIKVNIFDDDTYPFDRQAWAIFEEAEFPSISRIELDDAAKHGEEITVGVETRNSDSILYFVANTQGNIVASEVIRLDDDVNSSSDGNTDEMMTSINISSEVSEKLGIGANSIKIFAISESVLKPDFYESSFIVTENNAELPQSMQSNIHLQEEQPGYQTLGIISGIIIVIAIVIVIGIIVIRCRKSKDQTGHKIQ